MTDRPPADPHAFAPKKSLGQNFLRDPHLLQKIAELADIPAGGTVLEIGAGTGALTRVLAARAGRVLAVEVDDRLIPGLQQTFADQPHVEIIHGDILTLDLSERLRDTPYLIVANLPYYITSAILRHIFEHLPRPQRVVVTVQREVAERLIAGPGEMSLLAVSVQFYGQPRLVLRLKPAAFWPPPEVESAVVRIDVYERPPVDVPDEALFFRVVRAGFGQKRKQLRNALSAGLRLDKESTEALLRQAGIDPQRRAETLSLDEWAALTRAMALYERGA